MRTPTFSHRALAGLFLLVIAGLALWASWSGTPNGGVSLLPCPIRSLSGIPCPGCGITRASVAFSRGDFADAWGLHPFAFLLVPLALVYWLSPRGTRGVWAALPSVLRRLAVGLALALCIGLWAAGSPWSV